MRRRFLALATTAALALGGCATARVGSSQKIPVTSTPPGATIFVDGNERGVAPLLVDLDRESSHVLRIEKEGYQPVEIRLEHTSRQNPSAWDRYSLAGLGIVLGGLAGGFVAGQVVNEDDALQAIPIGVLIGAIAGGIGLSLLAPPDVESVLTPGNVTVTLRKAGGAPGPGFVILGEAEWAGLRWIRIVCPEGDRAEQRAPDLRRSY